MPPSHEQWVADLRDPARRDAASRQLRDILRKTLARGFGKQLGDADLDDLAQQALVRVIERLEDFRGDSRFTTWAVSIAVNGALGELRRRRHAHASLDESIEAGRAALAEPPPSPARLQREDARRIVREAIEQVLTDAQREALMAELGGLPLMEIARRTGRSRGALYKMLHDGRKRLRAHLLDRGLSAADLLDSTDGELTP
ncbi:MAG: sigma-70 family RNA polymerase sigma factor [Myxococcota bacterium]